MTIISAGLGMANVVLLKDGRTVSIAPPACPPQQFGVQYRQKGSAEWQTTPLSGETIELRTLTHNTTYEIRIFVTVGEKREYSMVSSILTSKARPGEGNFLDLKQLFNADIYLTVHSIKAWYSSCTGLFEILYAGKFRVPAFEKFCTLKIVEFLKKVACGFR